MNLEGFAWIILLAPLISAAAIILFKLKSPKTSAQISIGAVAISFVTSVVAACFFSGLNLPPNEAVTSSINWLSVGDFRVALGLQLDWLSLMMLLIVTGVGGLI